MAKEYLPTPSRAEFHRLVPLGDALVQCLDLSAVPPAARDKVGRAAAGALYVTLCRIQLPPFDEIPGVGQVNQTAGTNATRWVIPDTEIALERAPSGPRSGEFLFSAPIPLPKPNTTTSECAGCLTPARSHWRT